MNKFNAILRLIRFPNLIFIALTQLLTFYCIVLPYSQEMNVPNNLTPLALCCLILSTTLIAAAGYVINDYFDIRIDQINKPDKVVLDKVLSRKAAIVLHSVLNLSALAIVLWVAYETKLRYLALQFLSIALLLIYSMSFKRKLIIGNLVIAILTGLSVITLGVYSVQFPLTELGHPHIKLMWLYVGFAGLITIIREIVKDCEDVKGDLEEGCNTLPIQFGLGRTVQIALLLFFILYITLGLVATKVMSTFPILSLFYLFGILLPTFWVMYKLNKARSSDDFHKVSQYIKWLTLIGILSMLLVLV